VIKSKNYLHPKILQSFHIMIITISIKLATPDISLIRIVLPRMYRFRKVCDRLWNKTVKPPEDSSQSGAKGAD
jgi:hypothetical protein